MTAELRLVARAALVCVSVGGVIGWALLAAGPYVDVSIQDLAMAVPIASAVAVGLVVTLQRPEAPLGWLLLGIGALAAANAVGAGVGTVAAATDVRTWWVTLAAAVTAVSWPLTLALLTSFLILLFPDGLPGRRWRPLGWLAGAASLLAAAAALAPPTFPLTTSEGPRVANPLSWMSASQSDAVMGASLLVCLLIGLTALVALILRVRRAHEVLRLQLRWVTAALVLLLLSFFAPSWLPGMSSSFNPYAVAALTALFAALGIAITRYHLYDIDRVISRTVSYALVTGLLIAVYAGIVIAAGRLLDVHSSAVVAVATLAAAALARPILRRIQTAVDRRFNRARYDAALVVDGYGEQLRSHAHPEHVVDGLIAAVDEAIEPSSVAVWVRP